MDPEIEQYIRGVIADAWRKEGASPHAIAGVLANIRVESNFDPTLRHFDQPGYTRIHGLTEASFAHGLYQEGADEWNNYAHWMQTQHPGEDWRDPKLQSTFAAYNLRTNPQYQQTWAAMNNAQSPAEAASHYVAGYLKPAPQYLYARLASFRRNGVPTEEQWLGGAPNSPEPEIDYSEFGQPAGGAAQATKSSTAPAAQDIDYSEFGKPADEKLAKKSTVGPAPAPDQKSIDPVAQEALAAKRAPGASKVDANGNEIVDRSGGVPPTTPMSPMPPPTPPVSDQSGIGSIRMDPGLPPDPKSQAGQPVISTIGIRGYQDEEPTNIKGFPANSTTSMRQATKPPSVTIPRRADTAGDIKTDNPDTTYGHGGSGPGEPAPNQINPLKVDDAGYSSIKDLTQVQRQLGQNADWDKFEKTTHASTNVEDKRDPNPNAARLKSYGNARTAPSDFQAAGEDTFASKDREQDLSDIGLTIPANMSSPFRNVPMPRARPSSAPHLTDEEIAALPGTEVPYEEYAGAQ